jgi:chromosomal replication initiation ATPase DnaA
MSQELIAIYQSEAERWGSKPLQAMLTAKKSRERAWRSKAWHFAREQAKADQEIATRREMLLQAELKAREKEIENLRARLRLPEKAGSFQKVKNIVASTAGVYEVDRKDMLGERRYVKWAFPRMVAQYLVCKHTGWSLPKIGGYFNRDHTSIINARDKITRLIAEGQPLLIEAIAEIERRAGLTVEPDSVDGECEGKPEAEQQAK